MSIPLYELLLTDDGGVFTISLVDEPAIEVGWIKLSKEIKFVTQSAEKRILFGPLLIPNQPIYRNDNGKEFYIVFSKETIEKIRDNYFENSNHDSFNGQHISDLKVNGTMVESFISNKSLGLLPPQQFAELPEGTWFGSVKIKDDAIWNKYVKTNVFTGFSIEGKFQTKDVINTEILDKFAAYLDSLNLNIKQKK
jgi:hypothetical protein